MTSSFPNAGEGDLPLRSREAALAVLLALRRAGHEAYFAGGCVRDRLLKIPPTDYDIATSARPEDVRAVFRSAHSVGESFGVMLVRKKGFIIQVATFRTDGAYSDSRHPDAVTYSDAEHDAQRRDFTINGLFEDPLADRIIDFVGGQSDLQNRVVRAIGDPRARLFEDRLRMLRAVRFAARFGFTIEAETAEAIRQGATELAGVSRERIGLEVRRMLSDPNRTVAAWEIQYLGLDHAVLQEPNCLAAPSRLSQLPDEADFSTALAAWLLDRHEATGGDLRAIARRWGKALMLSNDDMAGFHGSMEVYQTLRHRWSSLGVAAQKRLASSPGFEQGLLLLQATDRQAFIDIRRRVIALAETGLSPAPLLDGTDLIAAGLQPGPAFKRVLDSVYDAQLEGAIQHRDEAMTLARRLIDAMQSEGP
jgi:tRNA nucleotidyltransferase/poly(A) polymerase